MRPFGGIVLAPNTFYCLPAFSLTAPTAWSLEEKGMFHLQLAKAVCAGWAGGRIGRGQTGEGKEAYRPPSVTDSRLHRIVYTYEYESRMACRGMQVLPSSSEIDRG